MTPEELAEEFEDGPPRPARVQRLRDPIEEHTGLRPPRRVAEVEDWLDEHAEEVSEVLESPDESE